MLYKEGTPKTNLRGSESGGYLSRLAISCMTVAMRHWALDATGYSPVRLTPAVGVTSGAHYRMSSGHSSPPQIINLRGPR